MCHLWNKERGPYRVASRSKRLHSLTVVQLLRPVGACVTRGPSCCRLRPKCHTTLLPLVRHQGRVRYLCRGGLTRAVARTRLCRHGPAGPAALPIPRSCGMRRHSNSDSNHHTESASWRETGHRFCPGDFLSGVCVRRTGPGPSGPSRCCRKVQSQ